MKFEYDRLENQYASSMFLNGSVEDYNDDKLKSIASDFILDYNKKLELLVEKEPKTDPHKRKILLGFGVVSGNNRAEKAIELALSSLLYKNKIIGNTNSVLLQISTHTNEVEIDELGIINDYIQEKSEYKADISMYVNEDENLGEALAITIILTEE